MLAVDVVVFGTIALEGDICRLEKAMPLRTGVDLRNIWVRDVGAHAVRLRGDAPCTRGVSCPTPAEGGI